MESEKKKGKGEEIVRLNRELSILNAISQTVNESIDLDEILNKATAKQPATSPDAKEAVKKWAASQKAPERTE